MNLFTAAQEEYEQVLDAHNKYRKIHNATAMRINVDMSAEAAEWAEHMASTGIVVHSDRISDGESLMEKLNAVRLLPVLWNKVLHSGRYNKQLLNEVE